MVRTLRRADRRSDSLLGLAMSVIGTLVVGFAATADAQDMDAVEIHSIELATGLHMLTGRGGNMLVSIGTDGVFLIDDQFAPLSPKILAKIEELGGGPVRMVFNTHWHGDHTGGNENLAAQGAVVIAHENVRVRMSTDQVIAALGREVPAAPSAAWPVATFGDRINLHLNGQTVHALHVDPAHTDGDAIVYFEEADVIHSVRPYVAGMYPFVDHSSGGRVEGFEGSRPDSWACGKEDEDRPATGRSRIASSSRNGARCSTMCAATSPPERRRDSRRAADRGVGRALS